MWEKDGLERLYDAVFHRKAVRGFQKGPLGQEVLDEILKTTGGLTALSPESPVAFRILPEGEIKGMVSAKSPHYLAVYAGDSPESRINAAFMLQQMDLWLSSRGFGCCWLGMPRPSKEAAKADGLPYVIMLAFGRPAVDAHRKDISEFKRKALHEITNTTGMETLLEPVRLAPSGVNRQPWFISGNAEAPRLCCKKNKFVSKALFGEMAYMDMGIALCHLWLAAEKEGRFMSFELENDPAEIPDGYGYVWTVRLRY